MNILLDINEFNLDNIFLMESKENTIIKGKFIKILYSTENFTMNGIYLDFPLFDYETKNFNGKNILYFDIGQNFDLISQFSKMENDIIHFFMKYYNLKKKMINTIERQLKNGMIKYYNYTTSNKRCYSLETSKCLNRIYLKISGIWETDTDFGITYKFIYY